MIETILDTHVHAWNIEKVAYAWLKNNLTILNRTYELEELLPHLPKAGVVHGVLVQSANNLQDTALMLDIAGRHPWIKGIVGWLPLPDPDSCARLIEEQYAANNYMKGVRHLIHDEADSGWLLQDTVLESLQLLAKNNLSYDVIGTNHAHLQTAMTVAEKIPGLRLVLDHLNSPPGDEENYDRWAKLMKEAAVYPNIYCKISGLGTTVQKATWGVEDIKRPVLHVLENFGTERCFCGGDWPVALLAGNYEKSWHIYREILAGELAENEQRKILNLNGARFYNLVL